MKIQRDDQHTHQKYERVRGPSLTGASVDDRLPPNGTFKAWIKKSWLDEATALGIPIPMLLENDYAFRPVLRFRVPSHDLDDEDQEQWADDEGDSLEDDFAELFNNLDSFADSNPRGDQSTVNVQGAEGTNMNNITDIHDREVADRGGGISEGEVTVREKVTGDGEMMGAGEGAS